MWMNETEQELVRMVLSGRTEAFEPLVAPYRGQLLGLASRMTGNREDGLEVVQEAMWKAFRHLRRYDPKRSFRNWLFRIAVNEVRDKLRASKRERELMARAAREAEAAPEPGVEGEGRELRSDLERFLAALRPRERAVFVLRDLEELSVRETAEVLACSEISVRVHLCAARRKLRDLMRPDGPRQKEER